MESEKGVVVVLVAEAVEMEVAMAEAVVAVAEAVEAAEMEVAVAEAVETEVAVAETAETGGGCRGCGGKDRGGSSYLLMHNF
jgi:hypothetical protein